MEARLASIWLLLIGVGLIIWLLVGCATPPAGTFCQIAKPHRFSGAAIKAMSDAEVKQELTFNKQGAALCGWRP